MTAQDSVTVTPSYEALRMTPQPMRCDTCAVRHKAACGALSDTEISRINEIAHHKILPAGSTILTDHGDMTFFANIISGVVKLTKTLMDGRQQIVGLQFASDFLGRPFRTESPYNAETVTEVHLCTYNKAHFERLVKEFEGLEHRLFQNTLDELDASREWMLLLGRKSAAEKIASFLLMVSKRMEMVGCHHQPKPMHPTFNLPLSRAEMADFLGLTLETVSRQISNLKVQKVIGLQGNRMISILDLPRLTSLTEVERD